jgi:RNA-directed DNA polymerase
MQVTQHQVTAFRALKTPADLAALLSTTERRLSHHLYRAPLPYRTFSIPKASGGHRTILAPPDVVKAWQTVVLHCMSAIYVPTRAVHGFAPARSVVTNAHVHTRRRLVLNLDLENFFPTIHFGRVRGVLQSPPFKLPPSVAATVAQLCCVNGYLPQGAPTSPLLSNLVCRGLDHQLVALARATGCRYSRYADDITLSTDKALFETSVVKNGFSEPVELGDALLKVIASNSFKVNGNKTRIADAQKRQEVTGLTVNAKVNVQRDYVKQIRGALFCWSRHGERVADQTFRTKFPHLSRAQPPAPLREFMRGRLAFLKMVRGEHDGVYLRYAAEFASLSGGKSVDLAGPNALSASLLLYSLWIIVARDAAGNELLHGTAFTTRDFGVVTSEHVFQHALAVRWDAIPAWDQKRRHRMTQVRTAAHYDLAAFDPPCATPAALLVDKRLPTIASSVVLAGFPIWRWQHDRVRIELGTVTSTLVASTVEHVLSSANIRAGNSGGPLLDATGRVVGVARYDATSVIAPNGSVAAQHLDALTNPSLYQTRQL